MNEKKRTFARFVTLLSALVLLFSVSLAPDMASASGFLPTRVHRGMVYEARPKSSYDLILLAGYDHIDHGALDLENTSAIRGGQSDFMLLLVIDHEYKMVRRLQINRDTITPIKMMSESGEDLGVYPQQICLAHAYGMTQEENNENLIWAVENMMGIGAEDDGVEIDWYMTMDISGINKLNELLGGVTVPIEDDFSKFDPTMVQGTTMRLTGAQAELYCRGRHYIGDSSNLNRMNRQRHYMTAAAKLFVEKVQGNVNFTRDVLNGMGIIFDTSKQLDDGFGFSTTDYKGTPITDTNTHYLMTNTTLDNIVGQVAKAINYDIMETEVLDGKSVLGAVYMEHRLEENAALDWTISTFYNPAR